MLRGRRKDMRAPQGQRELKKIKQSKYYQSGKKEEGEKAGEEEKGKRMEEEEEGKDANGHRLKKNNKRDNVRKEATTRKRHDK